MELWDAYYSDRTLAGVELRRGEPIPEGLWHLACEVLVRHTDGDYLLMQRDFSKPNYPGYFEASAGGSALKGETALECARRELQEECGITRGDFEPIGDYDSVEDQTLFSAFLCTTDWDKSAICLQEGETIAYKWVSEAEFIDFINSADAVEHQRRHYEAWLREKGYLRERGGERL